MQITDSSLASTSIHAMEEMLRLQTTGAPRTTSSDSEDILSSAIAAAAGLSTEEDSAPAMPTTEDELKVRMVDFLLEQATGTRFGLDSLREFQARMSRVAQALEEAGTGTAGQPEEESSQYSANGVIRTVDGGQVPFTASLTMTASFVAAQRLNISLGRRCALADNLVFDYGGSASELSSTVFALRLDSQANGLSVLA